MASRSAHFPVVRLLEEDPDLAEYLPADARSEAANRLIVEVGHLESGTWAPRTPSSNEASGHLGVLVLSGLLIRSVTLGEHSSAELLGAGDLLRPWVRLGDPSGPHNPATWNVLEPSALAFLDRRFVARAAAWPEVVAALLERSVLRSRMLAFQMAISHTRRVDVRLLMLFSQLANRWGRVTPDGIVVPLRLTHEWLGQLIGAQRPTVTTALSELSRRGDLFRRSDGTWLVNQVALLPHATDPDLDAAGEAPST